MFLALSATPETNPGGRRGARPCENEIARPAGPVLRGSASVGTDAWGRGVGGSGSCLVVRGVGFCPCGSAVLCTDVARTAGAWVV
eukprot:9475430-Heterocapsa_arctica.AAC.1